MNGTDHRVLQAAVDYVAALGGGVVEIGEGEYLMGDSLHLRSHVTVRGQKGKTILRKADAVVSPLALDGDFGEEQITVQAPDGIRGRGRGHDLGRPRRGVPHHRGTDHRAEREHILHRHALMADYMTTAHAKAATVYPVVGGTDIRAARVEDLVIEGNKEATLISTAAAGRASISTEPSARSSRAAWCETYHGDGISFQQSNDVTVTDCISEDNTHLGLHPGSGSQRPVVRDCLARRNGTDGLFLCWRVRHGVFENNRLEENGQFGISIGHKDSDNLLRGNQVFRNGSNGVFFRDESAGMSPHRNRLEQNVIADNGRQSGTAGIRIRGEPDGLILEGNTIRDTREQSQRMQTVGILIEERVGSVHLELNQIEAGTLIDDRREGQARPGSRE